VIVSTLTVVPEVHASGTAPCAEPNQPSTSDLMSARPRLLDLFSGGGGASAGYHAAGFDVVGVDIADQPDYPYLFLRADALDVLTDAGFLAGFDVVHASPPCQAYSCATPTSRRAEHPDLVAAVRNLLRAAVDAELGPAVYVMENVPGAPMPDAVTVCGDALRLGVRRHRLFESNVPLLGTPCCHDRPARSVPVYGSYGQRPSRDTGCPGPTAEQGRAAMGIDWLPWPALVQAIPPAYTHWLGVQLVTHLLTGGGRRAFVTAAAETSPERRRVSSPHDQGACVTDLVSPAGLRHTDPVRARGLRHCRCGTPLPVRPDTGRWPRYCSHACRQAAYRDRHRPTTGGAS
jgi:C-5 cytosine-specific DNA methylase